MLGQTDLQAQQLIITPEGHCIDAISVTLYAEDNGTGLLQQQQQLREQQQALLALEQPLQQAAETMQLAQRNLENTEERLNQCQQQLKQQQQRWQTASAQAKIGRASCRARVLTSEAPRLLKNTQRRLD